MEVDESVMAKRISPYSKIARLKEFVEYFIRKYQPQCPFCGKTITVEDDWIQGHEPDKLTIHHMDQDRSHNDIENLILCHRGCHKSYHMKLRKIEREKKKESKEE